jgi:hypothetical protein
MAKSHPVDETRSAGAFERKKTSARTKPSNRRTHGKRVGGTRSKTRPATGRQTKQQTCLDLLSRPEGTTVEELQAATGWRQHSGRGFLAGAVKKKFGRTLLSEKPNAGPRRYRIASAV